MPVFRAALLVFCASACGFTHGQATTGDDSPIRDALLDTSLVDSSSEPDPDAKPDATTSPTVPALLREVTAFANNSNAPLSATLPATPASGHVLILVGAAEHGGLTSVTGGGVATWTRATQSLQNVNIEIWYGVTNGSSATVTITFPSFSLPMWMDVSEWSGLATANALEGAVSRSGNTSPASAGTVTPGSANDLVLFAVGDSKPNTFGTPNTGTWTQMMTVTTSSTMQTAWYRSAGVAGAVVPGVSETAHSWDAAAAAFRAAP